MTQKVGGERMTLEEMADRAARVPVLEERAKVLEGALEKVMGTWLGGEWRDRKPASLTNEDLAIFAARAALTCEAVSSNENGAAQ